MPWCRLTQLLWVLSVLGTLADLPWSPRPASKHPFVVRDGRTGGPVNTRAAQPTLDRFGIEIVSGDLCAYDDRAESAESNAR